MGREGKKFTLTHFPTVVAGTVVALPLSPKAIHLPWYLHMHQAALATHGERLMTEIADRMRPHFIGR